MYATSQAVDCMMLLTVHLVPLYMCSEMADLHLRHSGTTSEAVDCVMLFADSVILFGGLRDALVCTCAVRWLSYIYAMSEAVDRVMLFANYVRSSKLIVHRCSQVVAPPRIPYKT